MKNKNGIGFYCLLMLLIVPAILIGADNVDNGAQNETELSKLLQLNPQQMTDVDKVIKMANSQAEKDRENYKGNPIALIEAGKRRRDMTDQHIENVLNDEQKQKYNTLKQLRAQNDELFFLQEGLMLTEEQSSRIKTILDDHRKMLEARRKAMRNSRGGSGMRDGGMSGGMNGGGMGESMGRGGRGGMGGGRRGMGSMGRGGAGNMQDRMLQNMKDMDAKKAKKIKKVLTKDQKVMYKEIRKMQIKELEQTFQKRMERMQKSRN